MVGSMVLAWMLWSHAPTVSNHAVWHTSRGIDSVGVAIGALLAGSLIWKMAFRAVRIALTLALLVGVAWLFWHFY